MFFIDNRLVGKLFSLFGVIGAILYKWLSIFYLQLNYSLYVALKYPPASIQYFYTNATSNISPQKKKSRRQRRRLSTAGALLIRNTSTRRQAATSSGFIVLRRGKQVERKLNVFTSDHRERLHPPSLCELWRDKQARLLEFGEEVIGAILYKRLSIFYLQLNYSLSVALKRPSASIKYFYINATSNISLQMEKSRRLAAV